MIEIHKVGILYTGRNWTVGLDFTRLGATCYQHSDGTVLADNGIRLRFRYYIARLFGFGIAVCGVSQL